MNKWMIIFAVIVLVAGVIVYLNTHERGGIYYGDYRECVQEKVEYYSHVPGNLLGEIQVEFNITIPREDAISLIESNNLTVLSTYDSSTFPDKYFFVNAGTPQGQEFYYMCRLEGDERVSRTYLPIVGDVDV